MIRVQNSTDIASPNPSVQRGRGFAPDARKGSLTTPGPRSATHSPSKCALIKYWSENRMLVFDRFCMKLRKTIADSQENDTFCLARVRFVA
jgi:hypothetical protein